MNVTLFEKGVLKVWLSGWAPNPYSGDERRPQEKEGVGGLLHLKSGNAQSCRKPRGGRLVSHGGGSLDWGVLSLWPPELCVHTFLWS